MKAAVLHNINEIDVEEVDKPHLEEIDQVLIKIFAAGLCGADLNVFIGNIKCKYPIIAGYCFSGVVEEIGAGVTGTQVGDKVCGLNFGTFGAFAEYVVVSQDKIYKIPHGVSLEEAAFMEPVALASRSLRLTEPVRGRNVLILGQGSLGLVHTQLFKKVGAHVFATDLLASRLSLSRRLGADHVLNPKESNVLKEISKMADRGIDIVVEATGGSQIVELLSKLTKRGVRMILFSVWNPEIQQFRTSKKDIEIHKVFGAKREDCMTALEMISGKKVDLNFLVNLRFSLNNIEEAYRLALNPSQGEYDPKAIGVLIHP